MADGQVLQALNGAVVALTKPAEKLQFDSGIPMDSAAAATISAPSVCLGIGIVRSTEPAKQMLYILTPIALQHLQQATTLEVWHAEVHVPMYQYVSLHYRHYITLVVRWLRCGHVAACWAVMFGLEHYVLQQAPCLNARRSVRCC